MKTYTYCWVFYGSTMIEAESREEADKKFDELDIDDLRDPDKEDDWELTLVREEDENGKTIDYIM